MAAKPDGSPALSVGGSSSAASGGAATPAAITLSSAGAKAASHVQGDQAAALLRARERRTRSHAVLLTAATAFVATVLAGTCLALGIAIGQRTAGRGSQSATGAGLEDGQEVGPPTAGMGRTPRRRSREQGVEAGRTPLLAASP